MAELTTFGFRSGTSFLHVLDIRFKLVFLALINLVSLQAGFLGLFTLSIGLAAVVFHVRLPLRSALWETRFFILLLLLVLVVRSFSIPGDPLFDGWSVPITRQGVLGGLLICWRLILVVLLGLIFVFTSRSQKIKTAVEWFLKPFPWIPGGRIAVMLGLMIRFLPVILEQAQETADAQKARGIENRKNPVFRLKTFAIPLLRRTFESGDRLAYAMEARCFSENRTGPVLSSSRKDWVALFVVLGFCLTAILSSSDFVDILFSQ